MGARRFLVAFNVNLASRDLAVAKAIEVGADVALANDPDADRCAVACPVDGAWRMLSGDELGWLLATASLDAGVRGSYACSVVSSTLLGDLAAAHGQPFVQTLTGFKWIARVPGLAFGYEEAIGYCVDSSAVRDKDGITAAVTVAVLKASTAPSMTFRRSGCTGASVGRQPQCELPRRLSGTTTRC